MIAIGNGESRRAIDCSRIQSSTVGCNAIVRHYGVDHLVCVDRRMANECLLQHPHRFSNIYTRQRWLAGNHTELKSVPELPYQGTERWDDPFHWGSGPYAVLLAATLDNKVDMIGFDLWSHTGTVNNLYKDTANYDHADKRAVDPRYWIHQIAKVFYCFPSTQFTIYQTAGWQEPEKWKLSNVEVDSISNFKYT